MQVKEKIKGHTNGAPSGEAGNVPGVLAIEDDEEKCSAMPCTSASGRGGEAARKARVASLTETVNKVQPPFPQRLDKQTIAESTGGFRDVHGADAAS